MALGDFPKKTLVQCTSENVLPMISLGVYGVVAMFKSLSHFEFIFL